MKIKNKVYFYIGLSMFIILLASYFININVDEGANFVTQSPLLGIIIFYNPFILLFYLLVAIVFIVKGIKKN